MMNQPEFAAWLCCLGDRQAFKIWRAAFLLNPARLSSRWRYRHA